MKPANADLPLQPATAGCAPPKGILLAIGGKENKGAAPKPGAYQQQMDHYEQLQILRLFLELTGKQNPRIAVITTASAEPDKAFADYTAAFGKLGIAGLVPVHDGNRKTALTGNTTELLANADAVIFSGGDQLRLTSVYGGTGQLDLLKGRYQNEAFLIAGTSAGAMAFSGPMIFQAAHTINVLKGEVQIAAGFGLLPWASIDTHFMERGRLARLLQVLATNPGFTGFGIEEDTAIVVRRGDQVEVTGSGTVLVLDGYKSHCGNIADVAAGHPVSIRDVQLHMLVAGDNFTRPTQSVSNIP